MTPGVPQRLITLVEQLSRRKKQLIALVTDSIMLPVALWSAYRVAIG